MLAFGKQIAVPTLLYAPLPFLLWAAVRFEVGILSLALLGASYLAFLSTSSGLGPFAMESAAEERPLSLQFFDLGFSTAHVPIGFDQRAAQQRRGFTR